MFHLELTIRVLLCIGDLFCCLALLMLLFAVFGIGDAFIGTCNYFSLAGRRVYA
jgi:hypothetical protein